MLWSEFDFEAPKFVELPGDYRHLNDVYINASCPSEEGSQLTAVDYSQRKKELESIMYDANWQIKVKFLHEPTKDWDFFIHCGFLP